MTAQQGTAAEDRRPLACRRRSSVRSTAGAAPTRRPDLLRFTGGVAARDQRLGMAHLPRRAGGLRRDRQRAVPAGGAGMAQPSRAGVGHPGRAHVPRVAVVGTHPGALRPPGLRTLGRLRRPAHDGARAGHDRRRDRGARHRRAATSSAGRWGRRWPRSGPPTGRRRSRGWCCTAAGPPARAIGDEDSRRHMLGLLATHWGLGSDLLTELFAPDADAGTRRALAQYQRAASSAETAVALLRLAYDLDVRPALAAGPGADPGAAPQRGPGRSARRRAGCSPTRSRAPSSWSSRAARTCRRSATRRPWSTQVRRFLGLPRLRRAVPDRTHRAPDRGRGPGGRRPHEPRAGRAPAASPSGRPSRTWSGSGCASGSGRAPRSPPGTSREPTSEVVPRLRRAAAPPRAWTACPDSPRLPVPVRRRLGRVRRRHGVDDRLPRRRGRPPDRRRTGPHDAPRRRSPSTWRCCCSSPSSTR